MGWDDYEQTLSRERLETISRQAEEISDLKEKISRQRSELERLQATPQVMRLFEAEKKVHEQAQEIERLKALTRRWNDQAALAGPCGSEFIDDPERVFRSVSETREALMNSLVKQGKRAERAEAERDALKKLPELFGQQFHARHDHDYSGLQIYTWLNDTVAALAGKERKYA